MKTIAVIGRKGGSGKTTIATHLAIGLHLRGCRTILADTDPQRSSAELLKEREGGGPAVVTTSGPKLFALQVAAARGGADALVIDTPAVLEEAVSHAVVLANLSLLVVRPTFLDIAAAQRTSDIVRSLRKPALVVLNQAPASRDAIEAPGVRRALEALHVLRLPVAPVVIRTRTPYQWGLECGRSVEEIDPQSLAAGEIRALCDFVERFALGAGKAAVEAEGWAGDRPPLRSGDG
jgi:chromosome partitioning protein